MAIPIQIKRGLEANLPVEALNGELHYTTDTKKIFVGNGAAVALSEITSASAIEITGSPAANQVMVWSSSDDATGTAELTYLNGVLEVNPASVVAKVSVRGSTAGEDATVDLIKGTATTESARVSYFNGGTELYRQGILSTGDGGDGTSFIVRDVVGTTNVFEINDGSNEVILRSATLIRLGSGVAAPDVVGAGDVFITDNLEVDGTVTFDGIATFNVAPVFSVAPTFSNDLTISRTLTVNSSGAGAANLLVDGVPNGESGIGLFRKSDIATRSARIIYEVAGSHEYRVGILGTGEGGNGDNFINRQASSATNVFEIDEASDDVFLRSANLVRLGLAAGSPSGGIGAGDVYVSQDLEVEETLRVFGLIFAFDGQRISSNKQLRLGDADETFITHALANQTTGPFTGIGPTTGEPVILTDRTRLGNPSADFNTPAVTYPTLRIHSGRDPEVGTQNFEYMDLYSENGVGTFALGNHSVSGETYRFRFPDVNGSMRFNFAGGDIFEITRFTGGKLLWDISNGDDSEIRFRGIDNFISFQAAGGFIEFTDPAADATIKIIGDNKLTIEGTGGDLLELVESTVSGTGRLNRIHEIFLESSGSMSIRGDNSVEIIIDTTIGSEWHFRKRNNTPDGIYESASTATGAPHIRSGWNTASDITLPVYSFITGTGGSTPDDDTGLSYGGEDRVGLVASGDALLWIDNNTKRTVSIGGRDPATDGNVSTATPLFVSSNVDSVFLVHKAIGTNNCEYHLVSDTGNRALLWRKATTNRWFMGDSDAGDYFFLNNQTTAVQTLEIDNASDDVTWRSDVFSIQTAAGDPVAIFDRDALNYIEFHAIAGGWSHRFRKVSGLPTIDFSTSFLLRVGGGTSVAFLASNAARFAGPTFVNGDPLVAGTPGAALEVKGTNGAFLPPRLTTAQETALTAVEGMVVWNTDTTSLRVYDGAAWGNAPGPLDNLTLIGVGAFIEFSNAAADAHINISADETFRLSTASEANFLHIDTNTKRTLSVGGKDPATVAATALLSASTALYLESVGENVTQLSMKGSGAVSLYMAGNTTQGAIELDWRRGETADRWKMGIITSTGNNFRLFNTNLNELAWEIDYTNGNQLYHTDLFTLEDLADASYLSFAPNSGVPEITSAYEKLNIGTTSEPALVWIDTDTRRTVSIGGIDPAGVAGVGTATALYVARTGGDDVSAIIQASSANKQAELILSGPSVTGAGILKFRRATTDLWRLFSSGATGDLSLFNEVTSTTVLDIESASDDVQWRTDSFEILNAAGANTLVKVDPDDANTMVTLEPDTLFVTAAMPTTLVVKSAHNTVGAVYPATDPSVEFQRSDGTVDIAIGENDGSPTQWILFPNTGARTGITGGGGDTIVIQSTVGQYWVFKQSGLHFRRNVTGAPDIRGEQASVITDPVYSFFTAVNATTPDTDTGVSYGGADKMGLVAGGDTLVWVDNDTLRTVSIGGLDPTADTLVSSSTMLFVRNASGGNSHQLTRSTGASSAEVRIASDTGNGFLNFFQNNTSYWTLGRHAADLNDFVLQDIQNAVTVLQVETATGDVTFRTDGFTFEDAGGNFTFGIDQTGGFSRIDSGANNFQLLWGSGAFLQVSGNELGLRTANHNNRLVIGGTFSSDSLIIKPDTTRDQCIFALYAGLGRQIVLTDPLNQDFDHGHIPQAHPTLFIHSVNQTTTQWLGSWHDGTDAHITTGLGDIRTDGVSVLVDPDGDTGIGNTTDDILDFIIADSVTATLNSNTFEISTGVDAFLTAVTSLTGGFPQVRLNNTAIPQDWRVQNAGVTGKFIVRDQTNTADRLLIDLSGNLSVAVAGIFGSSAAPTTSTTLEVAGTSGAFLLPRLTTGQRNSLTPANGMLIYNTTDNKFQGYENGGWANLI